MYSIGYDIGSSSVKVAIVKIATGECIALTHEPQEEMEIQAIQPNWAEQDPELWWTYLCHATHSAIKEAKIDSSLISSIGIAYQMHGLVLLDSEGKLLRNAIIWCDSRATDIGKAAYSQLGKAFCDTHFLNSPGNFTASKLKWVKENEKDLYNKIDRIMLPGDYIAYKLTGRKATTIYGLSEGIFWDFKSHTLSKEILHHFGFDSDLFPEIHHNFTSQGSVTEQAAKETGLPKGIPVTYRAGDQPNNALSLNILKEGEVAMTGGTSGVIYAVTNQSTSIKTSKINHFAHVNYTIDEPVLGKLLCINGAGIQYNWIRKVTNQKDYAHMNALADQVPIGSDGLTFIPFGNGAERIFDNKIVGAHINQMNFNLHGQGHLYRAALEGIAFAFMYAMELLIEDGMEVQVIRAGNDNLFRSDIFSTTLSTLISREIEIYDVTGAIGAARASSLYIEGEIEFSSKWMEQDYVKSFKPKKDNRDYWKAYRKWKLELENVLSKL